MNITLDTCIIFDYLNDNRKNHKNALSAFGITKINLFISETVIKEIKIPNQLEKIKKLINHKKLCVLKEPQMGTPIPTPIPIDFSHISPSRDKYIENYLAEHPGKPKHKILRDFLIAEAHKLSNNDCLLTTNLKDFYKNLDIKVIDYNGLFSKLDMKNINLI